MSLISNRTGIRFVLLSIAVNALIGIVVIASGDFSDLETKILVTSVFVTGASILSIVNLSARTQQFPRYVPEAGAIASVIGFGLLIYGIWTDFDGGNIARVASNALVFSCGVGYIGLLSRSRLLPRYQPVLRSAWLLAAVLIVMITTMIWAPDAAENSAVQRILGVVIVLLAAVTLSVPVLHRASRDELDQPEARSGPVTIAVRHCPSCGSEDLDVSGEMNVCRNCGTEFKISFGSS